MAIEKKWESIPVRLFVANGGTEGQVTLQSTIDFKVKQRVIIKGLSVPDLHLEVKRVVSETILWVGKPGDIDFRENLSSYLASTSTIEAHEQPRNAIPDKEYERAVYAEEPIVAKRNILVDRLGRYFHSLNPFPSLTIFKRNGIPTEVSEDTVDPSNNRPLPVKLTGVQGDVVIDADNLNIMTQSEGEYDSVDNPKPDSVGLVSHERGVTQDRTKQTRRITAIRGSVNTDTVSQDIALHDEDGNKYSYDNPFDVVLGQKFDSGNSKDITSADASPGSPWVGSWFQTRDKSFIRQLTLLASNVSSGLGGTFTFEYSETGTEPSGTLAPIFRSLEIDDFSIPKPFDLLNVGGYYRVRFEPDRVMTPGEIVSLTTTQRRQNDGKFAVAADDSLEEKNSLLDSIFSYGKAFDQVSGKAINLRPFNEIHTVTQCPTSLTANEDFEGETWIDSIQSGHYLYLIASTSQFTTVEILWSDDGINPNGNVTTLTEKTVVVAGPTTYYVHLIITGTFLSGRYWKAHIVNNGTAKSGSPSLISVASSSVHAYQPLIGIEEEISFIASAVLGRFINVGKTPDEKYINLPAPGIDSDFCTVTPLTANSSFAPSIFNPCNGWKRIGITIFSSHVSATNGVSIEFFQDLAGTQSLGSAVFTYDLANVMRTYDVELRGQSYKVSYTNDGTTQTTFRLTTQLHTTSSTGAMTSIETPVTGITGAQTVKSVLVGKREDNIYGNVGLSNTNSLKVAITDRPSEVRSRTKVEIVDARRSLVGGAGNTIYTVTSGKTLYISALIIKVLNDANSIGEWQIRDGTTPRVAFIESNKAVGAAAASSSPSPSLPEPLKFTTNVNLFEISGDIITAITLIGYEESN